MSTLFQLIGKAWRFNRFLTAAGLLHILLIPILLIAMVIDPRVISGTNGWIKPLKFAISLPIYSFTVTWLLTYIERRARLVQLIATVTGAVALIETTLITLQVVRGTTSHFNVSTAFDATVFSMMGTAITILATMNLLTVILLSLQRLDNAIFGTALRLGALASFVGMMVAFLMTSGPTPTQLAALEAGGELTFVGAHSVGIDDGGPSLPLLGWSTVGGDLRVPHFVGLHSLQMIPLLGFWLTRRSAQRRFHKTQRLTFVWVAGLGYIGWIGILTWQALRGQSVVTMDSQTGIAYLLLFASAMVACGLTMAFQRAPEAVTA